MKTTMMIPSYWARESSVGWKEGDAVYDHPIPIDIEGTLARAINSISILKDKNFQLVILAVPTTNDIETQVEEKVSSIIKSTSDQAGVETLFFGPSKLKQIHGLLKNDGKDNYIDLLQLRGYSNIRNMCLFIPHILDSEIAVLIDDDEVFEDPDFMSKAKEFIGQDYNGKKINAIAGYYLQSDGGYLVKKG